MRPRNTEKYQRYERAFEILQDREPLWTRTQIIEELNRLTGKPIATIRYYLKPAEDLRVRYTDQDLAKLGRMSKSELEVEARKRGIAYASLNAAVLRHHKTKVKPVDHQTKLRVERVGWLSWGDLEALAAFDLGRRDVRDARKALERWGLDLEGPNWLVHPKSGRRISLVLDEQLRLLESPVKFIKRSAAELGQRWEPAGVLSN